VIELLDSREGVLLPVKAKPGARKDSVVGEQAGALRVSVVAPAEQGKANEAIVRLLAQALGVQRNDVEISRGRSSSNKSFRIRGVSREELSRRLAELLAKIEGEAP
jgi:uncharacterized protein (TIGR00251 family)